ncbi:hypothetical protein PV08_08835 [Exophiala spinifera]|uniref:Choloylglycine hydrolase/NAAA C-terminal domain-containing protein n=1 Tax=Exophiala spinifera TaxID=91928 RepID=A0A0D2BR16_9EURO|nr:uncharacterized protein PV08_08835 [Exophiala spinifera]KIW13644.1 hypothetical protein PV08_08835 [Exophiala spinifera]
MYTHNSLFLLTLASIQGLSSACSRATYNARVDGRYTIGRTVDFVTDTNTTFWAFPAGLERTGGVPENALNWTTKYGSIIALMYNSAFTEGMNSEGLTGSTLYLGDSVYPTRNTSIPGVYNTLWMGYVLDNYATVAEAAEDICGGAEKFQVVSKPVVPGVSTNLHVAFTDTTGDNLIMEYTEGELSCYHSPNYTVMTNEPAYNKQLAINAYWEEIANYSLPGTARPADRFARLSFYNRYIPPANDSATAVSYTAGMMRAVSDPMIPLVSTNQAGTQDIWPTLWRTYIDIRDRVLYFESATSPMLFWFDFHDFDLSTSGETKVLSLIGTPWESRVGNVTEDFVTVTDSAACAHIYTTC